MHLYKGSLFVDILMFYLKKVYKEITYCDLKQLPSAIGFCLVCPTALEQLISSAEPHFGLDAWHERSTVNKTAEAHVLSVLTISNI